MIRLSMGTAAVLNFFPLKMDAIPTTGYFMIHDERKCIANCQFCPQARESKTSSDMLSRIRWPAFPLSEVVERLKQQGEKLPLKRICIQTINVPGLFPKLLSIIKMIKLNVDIPISVACHPLDEKEMQELHDAGVDRLGIPLDASTPHLFNEIKGRHAKSPYDWDKHVRAIEQAQNIFGKNSISTHLIVGLGETEREAIAFIQKMIELNVLTGLFAFTPIKGTKLETRQQPALTSYRKIQLARYLMIHNLTSLKRMRFNDKGELIQFGVDKTTLKRIISGGVPFQTSGCPNCNRPYYNERPGDNLFNYPKPLKENELNLVKDSLKEFL